MSNVYPVKLSIDYPDRKLDRLTSFFRIFTIIPIGFVAFLMTRALPLFWFSHSSSNAEQNNSWVIPENALFTVTGIIILLSIILAPFVIFAAGFIANLFNPIVLMHVFRRKYPKWWFDFYVPLVKFLLRVGSYFFLMTDVYPSTDEDQNVHFDINYPDVQKELGSSLPLIKWFLAIPHYIVVAFLMIAVGVCVIIAWFAILFTGKYPKGIFDFITGVMRWGLRVSGYSYLLVTDIYPPFSLD